MKAIMYHYVRERDDSSPYFRYLDVDNLRKQLDYFSDSFGFVEPDEWQDYLENGTRPKRDGKVVLTFDDAMRCHFDYVFPEMTKRGLWGIFYVPTSPYSNGVVLDVHRTHLLCGAFSGTVLMEVAGRLLEDGMISGDKIAEFRSQTYTRQVNSEGVTEFKRLLNYFVDYKYRSTVIDGIASSLGFEFNAREFYVTLDRLEEMKNRGMVIGSHTHTHPVMSRLDSRGQHEEIRKSFEVLGTLCSGTHKTYCHPYGGFHSFNGDTIEALESLDVSYAFNVEGRDINAADFPKAKLYLPRFDCNLFPHGKAS